MLVLIALSLVIAVNAQTVTITMAPITAVGSASSGQKITCNVQGITQLEDIQLVKVDQNQRETLYVNAVQIPVFAKIVPLKWKTQATATKPSTTSLEVKLQPFDCSFKGTYVCRAHALDGTEYKSRPSTLQATALAGQPTITVTYPRATNSRQTSNTAAVGQSVTVKCEGDIGQTNNRYTWFRKRAMDGLFSSVRLSVRTTTVTPGTSTQIKARCQYRGSSTLTYKIEKDDAGLEFQCRIGMMHMQEVMNATTQINLYGVSDGQTTRDETRTTEESYPTTGRNVTRRDPSSTGVITTTLKRENPVSTCTSIHALNYVVNVAVSVSIARIIYTKSNSFM